MAETLQTAHTPKPDFIQSERQRLEAKRKQDKTLFVRNILNSIFIILAIVAMVGVLVSKAGTAALYVSYGIGIVSILVKMGEVMIRMPRMLRKTEYEQRKENKQ